MLLVKYKVEDLTKGEIFNDYTNNVVFEIHSFATDEGTIASGAGTAIFILPSIPSNEIGAVWLV